MHKYIKAIFSGFRKIQKYQIPQRSFFNISLRDLRVLRGEKSSFTAVCWKLLSPLLLFLCFVNAGLLPAQEIKKDEKTNWLSEAQINIMETGMIKTTLPPGLHHIPVTSSSTGNWLDLTLIGPDNKQRPFELFWTERGDIQRISLEPSSLKLDNQKRLIWDGEIPDNFITKKIEVGISEKNYIGKVDIEGLTSSGWRMLATDVALYKAAGDDKAVIDISEGEYNRLRLSFSGYDPKFQEIPAFVEKIEIEGETIKTGYKEEVIKPGIEKVYDKESIELRITLPGSGIFMDNIIITTGSIFKGQWQFG